MTPNETVNFLYLWQDGTYKNFMYTDHEFIKEYVRILKSDSQVYLIDGTSTTLINKKQMLNKEEIEKLLHKDFLQEVHTSYKSPRELKTGGCNCGSWIFGVEYPHSSWCDIYDWSKR